MENQVAKSHHKIACMISSSGSKIKKLEVNQKFLNQINKGFQIIYNPTIELPQNTKTL